jgi:hypothetical protein
VKLSNLLEIVRASIITLRIERTGLLAIYSEMVR